MIGGMDDSRPRLAGTWKGTPSRRSDRVQIAGLDLPRRLETSDEVLMGDHVAAKIAAVVEFDDTSQRFQMTELRVTPTPGYGVTGEILRLIPVADVLRRAISIAPHGPGLTPHGEGTTALGPYHLLTEQERDRMREAGPVSDTVQAVGLIYTAARAVGDPPTRAVQDTFDIPRRTADRWVARARERGFIADTAATTEGETDAS